MLVTLLQLLCSVLTFCRPLHLVCDFFCLFLELIIACTVVASALTELLNVFRTCSNFKVRISALQALCAPATRAQYTDQVVFATILEVRCQLSDQLF